jgi:hypothetical protein
MTAEEWYNNVYTSLFVKHNLGTLVSWNELGSLQPFFIDLANLCLTESKISKKNVEFFLENLSWDEQQMVYEKLYKMNH